MTVRSNGPTRGLAALILPIVLATIAVTVSQEPSRADEGGVSFWVPGQFGSLAAVPAQPGWSFATIGFYTDASASYRVAAPGSITLGTLRERGPSDFVYANYVFATPVLGGQLAVGMTGVFGRVTASIDEVLTTSIGGVTTTRTSSMFDSRFAWGDLYPMVSLRWNHGVHNFMIYGTGDIPVGTYDPSNLANLGIGHGAADGGFGYTYFNPETGHEFSAATGVTYNLKALSAGSVEGIAAVCAHDENVTALHENGKEVAVGWQAVLDSWKAVPFGAFAELSCVMAEPVIKVTGSFAGVVGFEKVRGRMKDDQEFAARRPVARRPPSCQ